jgi:large subunit ribosomal protein L25
MTEVVLTAEPRTVIRKRVGALRRTGKVPGIYYMTGEQPIPITADELPLWKLTRQTETHIIRLKLPDGVEKRCVLREISYHPVTDKIVHFDLLGVRADRALRFEVPIVLRGQAAGSRDGGLVQHILHQLRIECLPDAIPDHVEVQIGPLSIGDAVHVRDISIPGVTILESPDSTIVSVIPPTIEKVVAPEGEAAAAATPAEPELIKKGKEDKEEEEVKEGKPGKEGKEGKAGKEGKK